MPYHLRLLIVALAVGGLPACDEPEPVNARPASAPPDEQAAEPPERPERPADAPDLAPPDVAIDAAPDAQRTPPTPDASTTTVIGCTTAALNRAAANDDGCYWLNPGETACRRCGPIVDGQAADPCDTSLANVPLCR